MSEWQQGNNLEIQDLVTFVVDMEKHSQDQTAVAMEILHSLPAVFPGVQILVYSPVKLDDAIGKDIIEIPLKGTDRKTKTGLQALIERVKTPYTFVLRDAVAIDKTVNVRRMLYTLVKLNVSAVGTATKGEQTGHWSTGCLQLAYRKYVLVYKEGYRHSENSCLFCDDLLGPFLAKTEMLRETTISTQVMCPQSCFSMSSFWHNSSSSPGQGLQCVQTSCWKSGRAQKPPELSG